VVASSGLTVFCGSFSAPKKPMARSLTRLDKSTIDLNLDTGLVVKLTKKVNEVSQLNAKLEKKANRYEREISDNKNNLAFYSKVKYFVKLFYHSVKKRSTICTIELRSLKRTDSSENVPIEQIALFVFSEAS